MKKIDLPVGKKVRGYGLLNEFGEFEFTPEQTGSRPDGMKLVVEKEDYKLFECKKTLRLVVKVPKGDSYLERAKALFAVVNQVISELQKYEF